MNNIENFEVPTSIAYMIANPGQFATRNAEGHIMVLANIDRPGYVEVKHFEQMERDGVITIHSKGGNALAEQFGRMSIHYTIN